MSVAVVTGGGRAIGAATATALAADGWKVCVVCQRDADAAQRVVERCGGRSRAVRANLSSKSEVDGCSPRSTRWVSRGLVNNTGIVAEAARVDELGSSRIQRMLAVNGLGPFLCAGAAVRRMSTRYGGAGGVIVNVSSFAARLRSPNQYVDYTGRRAPWIR